MKPVPSYLLALGAADLPPTVRADDIEYTFVRLFKHDFFAATALYENAGGKVIVKFARQAPVLGLPARWIGRVLASREAGFYQALADLDAVPKFLGRCSDTAIIHEYVEGEPLERGRPVPDDFFARLDAVIQTLHRRGMAYVDLEKRQNVLVGTDGKPYLIDFQISWHLSSRFGGETMPARWLRRRLQEGDRYHLLKLHRRIRPDQLTPEEIERSYRKPFYVRVHRGLTAPLLKLRRAMLNRLIPDRGKSERGTVWATDSHGQSPDRP